MGKAYSFVDSVSNGAQCLETLQMYMMNETIGSWLGLECEEIVTTVESYGE